MPHFEFGAGASWLSRQVFLYAIHALGLLLFLSACESMPPVRPSPALPGMVVMLKPIQAPQAIDPRPGLAALLTSCESLEDELVRALNEGVVANAYRRGSDSGSGEAPMGGGDRLLLEIEWRRAELQYRNPRPSVLGGLLYDFVFTTSFFHDEEYQASLAWTVKVRSLRNNNLLFKKELQSVVSKKVSDWQRGYMPYPSLRLPGALGESNWRRLREVFVPDVSRTFAETTAAELAGPFRDATQTPEFLELLRGGALGTSGRE